MNDDVMKISTTAFFCPLVFLSDLRLFFGGEIVDDAELLPDLLWGLVWIGGKVLLIMVATLAQQSSISDLMSR